MTNLELKQVIAGFVEQYRKELLSLEVYDSSSLRTRYVDLSILDDLVEQAEQKRTNSKKIKVTVPFQNAFCDMLYNKVQHAEFDWLEKYCEQQHEEWCELIQAVDKAMYDTVVEFMDNSTSKRANKEIDDE